MNLQFDEEEIRSIEIQLLEIPAKWSYPILALIRLKKEEQKLNLKSNQG